MSKSDTKAVKVLILLDYLMIMEFITSPELKELVQKGHDIYQCEIPQSKFNEIDNYIHGIEQPLQILLKKVNQVRMLSFIMDVCNDFLIYLRDPKKRKVWTDIAMFCKEILPINHTNFIDEIDLSVEISERILNAA